MNVTFVLEAIVVLGSIVLGTRAGGVGIGIWGGVGTFVLVFVFGEAPGEAPGAAMAIILGVVTSAALMQAAGGIDWMVAMAARVIEKRPRQITLIAPVTAFLFTAGAGTGNIVYPLLPVIYDVSYKNGVRPSKPLTVTVVQSGIALAASPVSAAMAAMLTLTDVAPYDLGLAGILAITFPACLAGIVVTSLVVGRLGGKDIADDPEIQARIAEGHLAPPSSSDTAASSALTYTARGRNAALAFLAGVLAIVVFGIFPDLRPEFADMTTTIVLVMLVVGALILAVGRPKIDEVPDQSVFKAGMVAAIALFGIAWLTATFIAAHEEYIVTTVGGWVTDFRFIFAIAVFLVAAMTTSQSTATRTIVPIGLAAGLPVGVATGMWAGALGGVYTLPANGPQIAAANFDQTGSTRLGTKLVDHSFFVPMLVLSVTTVAVGSIIGAFF
ncbi:anaerobic C4-dicarboxylate transporter family protein [Demequina sp. NBRC 110054]|uniref:anaerobic C4-dicarboxylate transporter family protein n=1 Tax=Demequina sp. NBRC 110054 TaxID=1570343 RepID=UPI000A06AAB4|nr:anaerobic C4-dicarboxylate transporter family protein [Demequina sp. NBRC 110054]